MHPELHHNPKRYLNLTNFLNYALQHLDIL